MPTPDQILRTIRENPRVPAPSQAVAKILSLSKDPNCDTRKIAESISRDGALTLQLLREVNSALYAGTRTTSSVQEACVRLGLKRVRAAVINQQVVSGLGKACPPGFHPHRYWQSALAISVAAHDLCKQLLPASAEDAGTAGLLCDIGIGLLAYGITDTYRPLLKEWYAAPQADLERIEHRALGITHAQVGAAILTDWKLDPHLISAVEHHHDEPPVAAPGAEDRFERIVAAAVTISRIALNGSDMEYVGRLYGQMEVLTPNADGVINKLLDTLVGHIQASAESLAVEIGGTEEMASNFEEMGERMPNLAHCFSHKPMSRQDLD
ncbi:MAG TPA: HDOD domain-containing protein [Phycisphaerae bacterium]|nr:HDOD domain-containing protein [Phycisphaerae bacterium]